MKLPTVSPGCTLDEMITPFLFWFFVSFMISLATKLDVSVMVTNSQFMPAIVLHKIVRLIYLRLLGSLSIVFKSVTKSVYV